MHRSMPAAMATNLEPCSDLHRRTLLTTVPSPRHLLILLLPAVVALVAEQLRHRHGAPVVLAAVPYVQAWGAYRATLVDRGLERSSIEQYRIRLNTWVFWLAHPPKGRHRKQWWQAGPDDLKVFCSRRCRPRAVNTGRPLAQATRAVYSRAVPPLYHTAHARGLIDADPFAGWRPTRQPDSAARPLELDDITRFFRFLRDHPDRRLLPLAALCYFNALRAGEPAQLTVAQLDLGGAVPRALVRRKGRRDTEAVPIPSALQPVLAAYLAWLAGQHGVGHWRDLPAGTPLFGHRQQPALPIGRSYASRLLARAIREAGIAGRPHDLRRTAANHVSGVYADNPGPVKEVLGHRGYGALGPYRVPPLSRVLEYFEQIPDPLTPSPPAVVVPHRVSRPLPRPAASRQLAVHRVHRGGRRWRPAT